MEKLKTSNDVGCRGKGAAGNPLVKWVMLAGLLGSVFVGGSILHVWLYIQQVQEGYRLAKLYEEHEQLVVIQRKLRLELSRFQDPSLLEELGSKEFQLGPPKSDQKIIMR
ncbi:MAG: cell division protein FtsL [Deltaproteobacteria bacterium]|jgi:hypothetical protein|nr:cell division protein FtsL [Deltaproteobacteria bacterium]